MNLQWFICFYSDRGGIQTPTLLIRSQMLYSVKLQVLFKNLRLQM